MFEWLIGGIVHRTNVGIKTVVTQGILLGFGLMITLGLVGCSANNAQTAINAADSSLIDVEQIASQAGIKVEDVAAVVNGTIITWQDVDDRITLARETRQLSDDDTFSAYLEASGLDMHDISREALKVLVDEALITIDAQVQGVDVSESQINESIDALADRYSSHSAFVKALESRGYTEDTYRRAVYVDILSSRLREAVISDAAPTDEQIAEYAVVVAPSLAGRRSSQILVSRSDYTLALDLYNRLKQGADFAELARTYSIDGSAENGGDMGWDSLDSFVSEYQNALDQLEPGEISPIIRTDFGYAIIKCTDKYEPTYDSNGNIDIDDIPQDLMDYIKESMIQTLNEEAYRTYIEHLEADAAMAIFDRDGNQVDPASIGLATSESEGASEAYKNVSELIDAAASDRAADISDNDDTSNGLDTQDFDAESFIDVNGGVFDAETAADQY